MRTKEEVRTLIEGFEIIINETRGTPQENSAWAAMRTALWILKEGDPDTNRHFAAMLRHVNKVKHRKAFAV